MPSSGAAVFVEADERAPDGNAGDEGAGAVDRIDDPDMAAVRLHHAMLFAEDAVVRIAALDQAPDRQLRRPVGLGHRVEAAGLLVGDVGAVPEPRQRLRAGRIGERGEKVQISRHLAESRRFVLAHTYPKAARIPTTPQAPKSWLQMPCGADRASITQGNRCWPQRCCIFARFLRIAEKMGRKTLTIVRCKK